MNNVIVSTPLQSKGELMLYPLHHSQRMHQHLYSHPWLWEPSSHYACFVAFWQLLIFFMSEWLADMLFCFPTFTLTLKVQKNRQQNLYLQILKKCFIQDISYREFQNYIANSVYVFSTVSNYLYSNTLTVSCLCIITFESGLVHVTNGGRMWWC